jgi:aspartyl-tRNA(Asn)/glutamyl-tRNA(Gln) amidotransferase subunit A
MPFDPQRLSSLSAAQLCRLYLAGVTDPVAVLDGTLARMRASGDPAIFITLTEARARREAEASARRYREGRPLGPLDGAPVAWKDLFDVAGTPTTAGSSLYRDAKPAGADAAVVRFLAAAGMVSVGKVNLTEFAYSGIGLNPHFGSPRNACDKTTPRIPGGSSSGSAVAVAAGLVPCAMGSDTGGSVRIPAALNGVVGLKTAEGRIDKTGVFPLSPTLDTVGPLARTVEDCVLLDAAMLGLVASTARRGAVADLRIVVAENAILGDEDAAVIDNFEAALKALVARGAQVTRRRIAILDEVRQVAAEHGTITAAEAWHLHRGTVEGPDGGRIDPRVIARIDGGRTMTAFSLLTIQTTRARLRRAIIAELDGALLAVPTIPHTAPEIAPLEADPELFHKVNLKTLRNTMPGNFLDLAGITLPTGRDARGLPTGILVQAPGPAQDTLMGAALAIEPVIAELSGAS